MKYHFIINGKSGEDNKSLLEAKIREACFKRKINYDITYTKRPSDAKRIAAEIDPNDTILVIAINDKAKIKQINPIFQLIIKIIPKLVATPLPPLNPKNIGYVCPITTNRAAISTRIALLEFLAITPTNNDINTATIPFNISHTNVSTAALFPTVLNTFVVPPFPLPFSLTSNPAIFLLIKTEKLTLPIKYAIIVIIK